MESPFSTFPAVIGGNFYHNFGYNSFLSAASSHPCYPNVAPFNQNIPYVCPTVPRITPFKEEPDPVPSFPQHFINTDSCPRSSGDFFYHAMDPSPFPTFSSEQNESVPSDSSAVSPADLNAKFKRRIRNVSSSSSRRTLPHSSSSSQGDSPLPLSSKENYPTTSFESPTSTTDSSKKSNVKETRYLERRLRNNLAAKRSRENRKRREDSVLKRAGYLEKANDLLQKQILVLKEEICILKGIPFDPNYQPTLATNKDIFNIRLNPYFHPVVDSQTSDGTILSTKPPSNTSYAVISDLCTTSTAHSR